MRPRFAVWLAALALAASVLAPATAMAAPKPQKHWNLYVDKLGVYTVTTADPKGQTLVAHPFATPEEAWATLSTPPTIESALTGTLGANGWFVSDVTLTWTIKDAPKVEPGFLQVTGGQDQLIQTDQQATTYSASATSVGGSAGPVDVTIARDATKPTITVGPGIANGDPFEVGSVPAEPTFEATDATSGVDTSSFTGYGTAIGTHTLVGTATDFAGNVADPVIIGYTVYPHQAQVVEPTKVDQSVGGPGIVIPGGINVPTAVVGVDYFLDGSPAAGFVEKPAGFYTVTAVAQTDYELVGYPAGGWTFEVVAADATFHATPITPTATDQTANAEGFITITAVDGVNYFIDNNLVRLAGDIPQAPGSYVVTAEPQFGYVLDGGVTSWPLTINAYVPPVTEVTPLAPSATDQTANASGFITIPGMTGVDYALDGAPAVQAGNHNVATGQHTVVATPQVGYALLGQTSWNLMVNAYVPPVQKQIEFVGRTVGDIGGQVLTLPAGWQPNDLAVAFVARNVGGTGGVPPLIGGWQNWSSGYTSTTYPYSSYRLMYRVLQPSDTTWNTVWSYRSAGLVVYRNAAPGAALGYASRSTTAINLTIPALTLQAPGTSWVGGFGYMESPLPSDLSPVAPLVVNRTAGAYLYGGRVGEWDTAGGVMTFPNTTLASGYYTTAAAASFELRLVP